MGDEQNNDQQGPPQQVSMPANADWHDIVVRRACPLAREIFYKWNMAQVDQNPELVFKYSSYNFTEYILL